MLYCVMLKVTFVIIIFGRNAITPLCALFTFSYCVVNRVSRDFFQPSRLINVTVMAYIVYDIELHLLKLFSLQGTVPNRGAHYTFGKSERLKIKYVVDPLLNRKQNDIYFGRKMNNCGR